MAEWGVDAATLDPLDLSQLVTAHARRKQFEAKVQAQETVRLLGEAMGGAVGRGRGRLSGRRGRERLTTNQFLKAAGKEVKA